MGFPGGLRVVKTPHPTQPPTSAEDMGSIPGRSPGEGNGSTLQYSCLGDPLDRGAWQAAVHEVTKESDAT